MSLTAKVMIMALALFAAYCGFSYAVMNQVMAPAFEQLEQDLLDAKLRGAERALRDNLEDLRNRVIRWESAAGLLAPGARWAPGLLRADELRTLDVLLAVDADGVVVWSRLRTANGWQVPTGDLFEDGIGDRIKNVDLFRRRLGLIAGSRATMLTVVSKTLGQDGRPLRLVFGRYLSADLLKAIQQFQQSSVELLNVNAVAGLELHGEQASYANTEQRLQAYMGLDDLWGRRLLVLKVSTPRTVTEISNRTMRYSFSLLSVGGVLILLLMWLMLRGLLLRPLSELIRAVNNAGEHAPPVLPNKSDGLAIYQKALTGLTPPQTLLERGDEIGKLAFAFNELSSRLHQSAAQVWRLAYHDTLTGLANRSLFLERISAAVEAGGERKKRPFALLFMDLDGFKAINDNLGHDVGDELLQKVAVRLRGCVRQMDFVDRGGRQEQSSTVARFGGDEFVMLLNDVRTAGDAVVVAERILSALAEPVELRGAGYPIGASIGIALFPEDGDDVETLVRHADMAMYEAKRRGRHRYFLYRDSLNAELLAQLELEDELFDAVAAKQMCLHYQPQFDLASGRVIGFEALARWRHPQRGLLLPERFIGIAEQNELIGEITRWALFEACAQASRWVAQGLGGFRVAVNISSKLLRDAEFAGAVRDALAAGSLAPERLEIELNEEALIEAERASLMTLERVRALGVRVVLHDFGSGRTSLAQFGKLPLDGLKIDRRYMRDLQTSPASRAVVAAAITLGRELQLGVIAAGVESEAARAFLKLQGCPAAQGKLFTNPLPAARAGALLRQSQPSGGSLPA